MLDPYSLAVMKRTAPIVLQGWAARRWATRSATQGVQDHLSALRRGTGLAGPWSQAGGVWVGGNFLFADQPRNGRRSPPRPDDPPGQRRSRPAPRRPLAGRRRPGRRGGTLSRPGGFRQEHSAFTVSGYAGYYAPDFYVQGIVGGAPDIALDRITRPAAYGLTASARTSASALALDIEAGRPFRIGDFGLTPFVGSDPSGRSRRRLHRDRARPATTSPIAGSTSSRPPPARGRAGLLRLRRRDPVAAGRLQPRHRPAGQHRLRPARQRPEPAGRGLDPGAVPARRFRERRGRPAGQPDRAAGLARRLPRSVGTRPVSATA